MVAFAAAQPDTPGKLAMHAFSYEHMELAAYELLQRLPQRAGDAETARWRLRSPTRRRDGRAPRQPCRRGGRGLPGERDADELAAALLTYLATPTRSRDRRRAAQSGSRAGRRRARCRRLCAIISRRPRAPAADRERLLTSAAPDPRRARTRRCGGRAQPRRLLRRPARFDHQAGRLRLRLRAPRDRRLRAAAAGRRPGRDDETVAGGEQILADERRAAEQIAATWDDAVDAVLGNLVGEGAR